MVHVLVVAAVEETELLLAVRRIVSGIDVQQNFAALAYLTLFPLLSLIFGSFAYTAADGTVAYGLKNYVTAYNDPIIARL